MVSKDNVDYRIYGTEASTLRIDWPRGHLKSCNKMHGVDRLSKPPVALFQGPAWLAWLRSLSNLAMSTCFRGPVPDNSPYAVCTGQRDASLTMLVYDTKRAAGTNFPEPLPAWGR